MVLPGPKEPKGTIKSYLEPLVNDLLELWSGVPLYIQGIGERTVRCALLVSCDSPAGRKACGFLGHNGFTKCKKISTGGVGQKDYSGFDRQNWVYCSKDTVVMHKGCKTKASAVVLLSLPYFDPISMRSNAHSFSVCRITYRMSGSYLMINSARSKVELIGPAGIGRIPLKIQSGFAAFTADHFKNWVLF